MARRATNVSAVRAAREAERDISASDSDDATQDNGLPPDCPVRPLGKDERVRYYLDSDRQLAALADKDHSRLGLLGLFGKQSHLLYKYWPRSDKGGNVTGWRPELAAETLMAACSRAGVWDPAERQRGRGAWLGDNGDLVLHTGTRVLVFPPTRDAWRDHRSEQAGVVGRYVYGAASQVGAPSSEAADGGPEGPACELWLTLLTWHWRREHIDPVLLLGWIGAAMLGGALRWRPMAWLTGGKGTGKSTLQELLKGLFGGGLIQTADSSPAGLWQALRHQTLPVAFDELEADEDNRRSIGIVKLARVAASGALMLRGGADHRGTEFTVRSSFLFSSILMPPLTPQDRSRITVLDLHKLKPGTVAPVLDAKQLGRIGAQLRRRMVDGWWRLSDTIAAYHAALSKAGHTSRAADQIGTLLACADILQHDRLDEGVMAERIRLLSETDAAGVEDDINDEERCLAHLLSTAVDPHRSGGLRTLAEWIRIAAQAEEGDPVEANRVLGVHGLRVTDDRPRQVAIANYHQGLAKLFQGSHWAGRSGTQGVWVQALRRLPGADRSSSRALYFGGVVARATLLPIDLVVPPQSVRTPVFDGV